MLKCAPKHLLAICYLLVLTGCASNPPAHMGSFTQKAQAGDAVAQRQLGLVFDFGKVGVPQNRAEAARWYQMAADQGDPISQNNLGSLYEHGQGVPKDMKKAAQLYRDAADQEFPMAQVSLGRMYDFGHGVPQSYVEANFWYRRAAESGDAQGMFNLAVNYGFGQGVPEDKVEAYKWLDLARRAASDAQTKQWVGRALNDLKHLLTQAQIAEGASRAKEWMTVHGVKH